MEDRDARWLPVALRELGTKEVPGAGDNPRIVAYHAVVDDHPTPDAVPWCASFANWTLRQVGVAGTMSRLARSFLPWGEWLAAPVAGCITVLERAGDPASGHVGFWIAGDESVCWLLGGNQGDAVTIAPFQRSRVLGWRWPKPVPMVPKP